MSTEKLGLLCATALAALAVLSMRSCAVDDHHEHTKQAKVCADQGGKWVNQSEENGGDYCQHPGDKR